MKNTNLHTYSSYVRGVDFIPELVVARCWTCGDIYKAEENKEHTSFNRESFCSIDCCEIYKHHYEIK